MGDDVDHQLAHLVPHAILAARQYSDFDALIFLLNEGGPITREVRTLLVDILTGELKRRPRGRHKDKGTYIRSWQMTLHVEELQKQEEWKKKDAAIEQVAKEFGVTTRTVERAIKRVTEERSQKRRATVNQI